MTRSHITVFLRSFISFLLRPVPAIHAGNDTAMFERTLQDLIRGLRAHKSSSQAEIDAFLAEAVEEIRGELRGREMDLKAEGVVKMCYVSPRI
jgi:hypothetical protein